MKKIVLNEQEVIEFYTQTPMSIKVCAEHFNVNYQFISKVLDKYNILRHSKSAIFNPNIDENFFEVIDTEAKAYFLGFIIADGNIYNPRNHGFKGSWTLSIGIDEKDIYIALKFLECIGLSNSIGHDGRGTIAVAVRSDKIAADLKKYGIIEKKTFHTYLPDIPKELYPHLLRGILDGDGSICSYVERLTLKFRCDISYCGTNRLMNDIADWIVNEVSLSKRPNVFTYKKRNISEIKIRRIKDVYKFGEYLYKDATIFLQRKRDKYDKFLEFYKDRFIQENTEVN